MTEIARLGILLLRQWFQTEILTHSRLSVAKMQSNLKILWAEAKFSFRKRKWILFLTDKNWGNTNDK